MDLTQNHPLQQAPGQHGLGNLLDLGQQTEGGFSVRGDADVQIRFGQTHNGLPHWE